jgi:hypothetical protein
MPPRAKRPTGKQAFKDAVQVTGVIQQIGFIGPRRMAFAIQHE